jgi:hypothetical protein
MRASAQADAARPHYWHGKIIYYYLVSVLWNLKQKHLLKAISRLMFASLAIAVSIHHILSMDFWRGTFLPHYNLVRITLGDLENKLYIDTVWER